MTRRCLNTLTLTWMQHATGLRDSSAAPDWLARRARPNEVQQTMMISATISDADGKVRCKCCKRCNCQLPVTGKKDEPQHLLQGAGTPSNHLDVRRMLRAFKGLNLSKEQVDPLLIRPWLQDLQGTDSNNAAAHGRSLRDTPRLC